jgi:hypothetical protein
VVGDRGILLGGEGIDCVLDCAHHLLGSAPLLVHRSPLRVDACPGGPIFELVVGVDTFRTDRLRGLTQLAQLAQQRAPSLRAIGARSAGMRVGLAAPALVGGARGAQLAHHPPLPAAEKDVGLLPPQ